MAMHDHNKTGSSTLFMLGVAGMGLAIAMFFDARTPRPVRAPTPVPTQAPELVPPTDPPQPQEGTPSPETATSIVTPAEEIHGHPDVVEDPAGKIRGNPEMTSDTQSGSVAHDSVSDKTLSSVESVPDQNQNQTTEKKKGPLSYREMFIETKAKEEQEIIDASPDHSYTGDGSNWSKRMYFIKEAYRRSREATPVDPVIKARVKYKHEAMKAAKQK